jgi:hypothetical protein
MEKAMDHSAHIEKAKEAASPVKLKEFAASKGIVRPSSGLSSL